MEELSHSFKSPDRSVPVYICSGLQDRDFAPCFPYLEKVKPTDFSVQVSVRGVESRTAAERKMLRVSRVRQILVAPARQNR